MVLTSRCLLKVALPHHTICCANSGRPFATVEVTPLQPRINCKALRISYRTMAKSSKSGSDAGVFLAEDVAEQGFEAPSSMLQGGGVQGQIPPNNYAGLAWCSCFFCCWPIGLYAIITSNSVYSKWQSGDYQGAKEASETTRQASIASIGIGTILLLLYMLTAGSAASGSHP